MGALGTDREFDSLAGRQPRAQLQALITKTAALANQGKAAAQAVVDDLEKKGIPTKAAAQSFAK
jgi:hypothetical protein